MPADEGEQISEEISPIDISTIRNSASIQSHLSVSNSLKRLRISPSWYRSFPKDHIYNPEEVSNQQFQRIKKADALTFLQENHSETAVPAGRFDRPCVKLIARYAFIAYCFLSCIVATCRLYAFFCTKTHTTELQTPATIYLPTMDMSVMTNYLLKAIPCCTTFEPFVLSNNHKGKDGQVSFVGWLNESEVDSIKTWSTRWPGPISILVASTALPGSPSHGELLRKIKKYSGVAGLSIHLLLVQSNFSPTPNVYMNLARLMATTNWTLLFPGDTSRSTGYNLYQSITRLNLENAEDPIVLTFGFKSYPFPPMTPVLIKRAHSFWCTERMFLNVSRKSDWDECLWQIALEMLGKSVKLNTAAIMSVEKDSSTPKGWTRQRLSARFRAEMCNIAIKHIAAVYPRNRQRALKVQWIKDFCTKTIDKNSTF